VRTADKGKKKMTITVEEILNYFKNDKVPAFTGKLKKNDILKFCIIAGNFYDDFFLFCHYLSYFCKTNKNRTELADSVFHYDVVFYTFTGKPN
jgi:hypothetical protein